VFALYNHYLFTKNKFNFSNQYKTMDKSEQAHNCVSCGKCVDLCPQKLDIPKYMKEIADLAT
jgi:predicted aldo/keto reductase-like oxidoreductase